MTADWRLPGRGIPERGIRGSGIPGRGSGPERGDPTVENRRDCVEVLNVTVAYDEAPILTDVEWRVPCGTLAAVIGPNGGGKSTLLRTLVGGLEPAAGTVRVLGVEPKAARKSIAYLPQYEQIDWRFPIRALDVVMQGRLPHKSWWNPKHSWLANGRHLETERAMAALERVRLAHKARAPVGELSGGQRQRVLLAKALVQDAQLILLDEPATALDATAQHDLLDILEELKAEGRTIVMTTHDLNCLTDCFDSLVGIKGRVVGHGTPEETLTPKFLTELFGQHIPMLTRDGRVTMVEH